MSWLSASVVLLMRSCIAGPLAWAPAQLSGGWPRPVCNTSETLHRSAAREGSIGVAALTAASALPL